MRKQISGNNGYMICSVESVPSKYQIYGMFSPLYLWTHCINSTERHSGKRKSLSLLVILFQELRSILSSVSVYCTLFHLWFDEI